MKKAEQRLQEEVDRVAHYLDPSTEAKIREVAEKELIARHMVVLAEMEHRYAPRPGRSNSRLLAHPITQRLADRDRPPTAASSPWSRTTRSPTSSAPTPSSSA